jgi:hypothetical protein
MNIGTVAQAIQYKQGHYNLILWGLNHGYNITILDENKKKILNNTHDYQKICSTIKDMYKFVIVIIDQTKKREKNPKHIKGWGLAITDNEDEDIISDYSTNKFMDKWEEQFSKFHEELNQILNNENYWR